MRVTNEAYKALKGSVAKWAKIVDGRGADRMADNCPLCKLFCMCNGCPIWTDRDGCSGTPYDKWHKHHSFVHGLGDKITMRCKCKDCYGFAMAEYLYLLDLLERCWVHG